MKPQYGNYSPLAYRLINEARKAVKTDDIGKISLALESIATKQRGTRGRYEYLERCGISTLDDIRRIISKLEEA